MAHFIQTGPYSLHCFILLLEFNRVLDNGIIIILLSLLLILSYLIIILSYYLIIIIIIIICYSHVSVSSSQIKTTGKQTSDLFFGVRLCRHLSSDSRGTKPLFWRARDALGQHTLKGLIIKDGNFLCLSSPSAILTKSHCGFFLYHVNC